MPFGRVKEQRPLRGLGRSPNKEKVKKWLRDL